MPSARRRSRRPYHRLHQVIPLPTPAATRRLGRQLAAALLPGDVVLLHGALGSGKTTFTRGVAVGLGIRAPVSSPTFVLRKRYVGERKGTVRALNHVDAYRLRTAQEVRSILDESILEHPHDVWVIEWGARFRRLFTGKRTWHIHLAITEKWQRSATVHAPRRSQ